MKKIGILMLALMLVFMVSCKNETKETAETGFTLTESTSENAPEKEAEKTEENIEVENKVVTITVKDFGDMVLELYPEYAPETVANFIELAESGFYEGLVFHRIYKGFMIQGGSTDGIGITGSDKKIKGEFKANGVNNPISHERGVISMARTNDPNSASSQFFICDADSDFLDGSYAAFGKLIEGYDVLDAIASVDVTYGPSGEKSSPLVAPVIEKVTVNK